MPNRDAAPRNGSGDGDDNDANVVVAIDISAVDCDQCDRPNCAGGDTHQPNAVYLGCRRCGLELNDVRPLFFRPAAERSRTTCELCGMHYRTDNYTALHFLSHFNELTSATRPLLCVQCAAADTETDAIAESETGVSESGGESAGVQTDADDDHMQDVEMLAYECDECDTDELFGTEKSLDLHRLYEHGIEIAFDAESEPEPIDSTELLTDVPAPARRTFECRKCKQLFETANKLEYHQAKAHRRSAASNQRRQHRCRLCEEDTGDDAVADVAVFASQRDLRQHIDAEHRNADTGQFDCANCDRTFACASFLAMHRLKHTRLKPFACDLCDARFGRLAHMKYHRASKHVEQHQFRCDQCPAGGQPKSFKTAESLRRHRTHMHPAGWAEERRYPCEQCEKVFRDSSDLRRHRWTHGGFERKYGCELCEKRFHEPKGLRKHRLAHVRRGELVMGDTMDVVVAAEEECVAS